MSRPIVVAYGGGVNSTALLVQFVRLGIRPEAVLMADVGAEWPETYLYVNHFNRWLRSKDFPPITVVRHDGKYRTLEEEVRAQCTLPPPAFGFKTCSLKYKLRPQEKWLRAHFGRRVLNPATHRWRLDLSHVVVAVGFDAGEEHRMKRAYPCIDTPWERWFPLMEWDWDRRECIRQIRLEGIPVPRKSSCFFCPYMKRDEVAELAQLHPDLMTRALDMEANATIALKARGLGRTWSWRDHLDERRDDDAAVTLCGR